MTDLALHADLEMDDPGVEPEGVHFGSVFVIFAVSVVLVVILALIGYEVAQGAFRTAERDAIELTGYPVLRETHADAKALLSRYEQLSGTPDRYRIPIDRAMDLIVNEAAGTTVAVSDQLRLKR